MVDRDVRAAASNAIKKLEEMSACEYAALISEEAAL